MANVRHAAILGLALDGAAGGDVDVVDLLELAADQLKVAGLAEVGGEEDRVVIGEADGDGAHVVDLLRILRAEEVVGRVEEEDVWALGGDPLEEDAAVKLDAELFAELVGVDEGD